MKKVKVKQITIDDLANLPSSEDTLAVRLSDLSTVEFAPWGGKDADGNVAHFGAKDEIVRIKELQFTYAAPIWDNTYILSQNSQVALAPNGNVVVADTPNSIYPADSVVIGGGNNSQIYHSVAVGTSAGCGGANGCTIYDTVDIGYKAGFIDLPLNRLTNLKTAKRNVSIGSEAGTMKLNPLKQCITIGASTGLNAYKSKTTYDFPEFGNDDPLAIWNLIAIGDGAGRNVHIVSGSGAIFIGRDAGGPSSFASITSYPWTGEQYPTPDNAEGYADNSIFMGHGCTNATKSFTRPRLWKWYSVGAIWKNVLSMMSAKYIVHTTTFGDNTLPSMILDLEGYGPYPKASRLFGPVTNQYGNFMDATSITFVSANTYPSSYTIEGTSYGSVGSTHRIISAAEGFFDAGNILQIGIPQSPGRDYRILLMGDTKCNRGQIFLASEADVYDASEHYLPNLNPTYPQSSHKSITYMGDDLYGDDGQARLITARSVGYVDGAGTGHLHQVITVKKIVQMFRTPSWGHYENYAPYRHVRSVNKTFEIYWPSALYSRTGLQVLDIYGRDLSGSWVQIPNINSLLDIVVDSTYVYLSVNPVVTVYDEFNVRLDNTSHVYPPGQYSSELTWSIADDKSVMTPFDSPYS
jgi:hypothetical protein